MCPSPCPVLIQGHVVMGNNAVSPYQQVIEKTKSLSFRSQMLAMNIEKKMAHASRNEVSEFVTTTHPPIPCQRLDYPFPFPTDCDSYVGGHSSKPSRNDQLRENRARRMSTNQLQQNAPLDTESASKSRF